jgi:hypothetical protein
MRSGYRHPGYAASLAEFGAPLQLPRSGGWLLVRPIPGSQQRDAMGCYPLFFCDDPAGLDADLRELARDLVSVVLVTDPVSPPPADVLASTFDFARPYKAHYFLEAGGSLAGPPSRAHAKNVRRGLRKLAVERCTRPLDWLPDWNRLYGELAERHAIAGLQRFSEASFAQQFVLPGFELFRASVDGQTVGLHAWYVQDGGAYSHLSAFSAAGYQLDASYALQWHAIEHFHALGLWINLGGGLATDEADGLSLFKRGFARASRMSTLCGKVLQPQPYRALCVANGAPPETAFFPAYRSPSGTGAGDLQNMAQ